MDFVAVVDQVIALLRQRGRVAYRTLKRQFQLDDAALEDVKNELIEGQAACPAAGAGRRAPRLDRTAVPLRGGYQAVVAMREA